MWAAWQARPLLSRRCAATPTALAASGRGGALAGPLTASWRGVARVRINRFTGLKTYKVRAPKTEWQIAAEKEFLQLRDQVPKDEYQWHLTQDDVRQLSPEMQRCLTLRCASSREISKWRTHQWIRKFQQRAFDTESPAVQIGTLTEKILRVRAHLLRNPMKNGHQAAKRVLSQRLAYRIKYMKILYKEDYQLYRHVCAELGIRCIQFAVPGSKDPQKMANPQAVDGDKARFLIRQRMYKGPNRPRRLKDEESFKLVRYTRHPLERVPDSHGKPVATPQQVSRAWPYGVRPERVAGKQTVYNPTAPGKGFWPARGKVVGGKTPE